MLRIEPEIRVLPRHEAGIDMIVLVPGDGIVARRERQLQKQRRQQACHSTNNPNALPPSMRVHLCLCCIDAAFELCSVASNSTATSLPPSTTAVTFLCNSGQHVVNRLAL